MTARAFDQRRRTGPLDTAEQTVLRRLLDAFPRPLLACRELQRFAAADALYPLGVFRLQDRGWLRYRRGWLELTNRCARELPAHRMPGRGDA
jgi:hypothetical protein